MSATVHQMPPLNEWRQVETPTEYRLMYDSQAIDEIVGDRLAQHAAQVNGNVARVCNLKPHETVTATDLFLRLGDFLFHQVHARLASEMAEIEQHPPSYTEFVGFIASFLSVELTQGSINVALDLLEHQVRYQHSKETVGVLLTPHRYREIVESVRTLSSKAWRDMESDFFRMIRGVDTTPHGLMGIDLCCTEREKHSDVTDALLQIVFSIRDKAEYVQSESVSKQCLLNGMCVATQLDYSNVFVLSASGVSSVMAAACDSGHPVVLKSALDEVLFKYNRRREEWERSRLWHPPRKPSKPPAVIEDGALLGREIVACECRASNSSTPSSFTSSSSSSSCASTSDAVTLTAVAFRNDTKVSRFVEFGTGHRQRMLDTLCMVPEDLPEEESTILFYPREETGVHANTALKEIERVIREKARPLTCWQRCADWFILRMFVVTGTLGRELAAYDSHAKRFLCSKANKRKDVDGNDANLSSTLFSCETSRDRAVSMDDVVSLGELDVCVECSDDGGESSEEDLDARDADLLEESLKENIVAKKLRESWIHASRRSTPDMGNKINVFRLFQNQPWCEEVYMSGLFQSLATPCLAASPDAIARVRPPTGGDSVLCACEFRTSSLKNEAVEISRTYGTYFACCVEDQIWWKAVPFRYRGKILHQAVVLNLSHVVFVVASTENLLYGCLVHVTEQQKEVYSNAINKWAHLISWAHPSIYEKEGTDPTPPPAFEKSDVSLIKSHMPCWRALRKRVEKYGPVRPLHTVQAFAQIFYDFVKEDCSQHVAKLSATHMKFTMQNTDEANEHEFVEKVEGNALLRAIKQLAMNTFVLYQLHFSASDPDSCKPFRTVENFDALVNDKTLLVDFSWNLVHGLMSHALSLKQIDSPSSNVSLSGVSGESINPKAAIHSDTSAFHDEASKVVQVLSEQQRRTFLASVTIDKENTIPKRAPKIHKLFSSEHGFRFRVCGGSETHKCTKQALKGKCVLCSGHTLYQCEACRVRLHYSVEKGCYDKWHQLKVVEPSPVKPRKNQTQSDLKETPQRKRAKREEL